MTYARIENGIVTEYPVYEGEIRLRYSNVSFPTPFQPPEGYEAVADVEYPSVDYTKNVAEGEPVKLEGQWTRQWVVSDASAEELAERIEAQWGNVRRQRNSKLTASDWTQLPDCRLTNTQQLEWASYRQALRDITTQEDPFNITWPQEP